MIFARFDTKITHFPGFYQIWWLYLGSWWLRMINRNPNLIKSTCGCNLETDFRFLLSSNPSREMPFFKMLNWRDFAKPSPVVISRKQLLITKNGYLQWQGETSRPQQWHRPDTVHDQNRWFLFEGFSLQTIYISKEHPGGDFLPKLRPCDSFPNKTAGRIPVCHATALGCGAGSHESQSWFHAESWSSSVHFVFDLYHADNVIRLGKLNYEFRLWLGLWSSYPCNPPSSEEHSFHV